MDEDEKKAFERTLTRLSSQLRLQLSVVSSIG